MDSQAWPLKSKESISPTREDQELTKQGLAFFKHLEINQGISTSLPCFLCSYGLV